MIKKNGLIVAGVLIVAIILIFWGNRLNFNSTFPRIILISMILVLIHYLLYVFVKRMRHPKSIFLFFVTILFGVITFIFMVPFVINLIHSVGNDGGFNEDYSGVFLMIAGIITLLSFALSYFFKKKLIKSKR
jgi:cytochrome bd-type quinol oxidase subunit 2